MTNDRHLKTNVLAELARKLRISAMRCTGHGCLTTLP